MRIRTIKPEFFKDEDLAELDPLTRILFIGLWCLADRDGRLEYRPKYIKAEVLPYDDCDIEKMVEALGKQRGSNGEAPGKTRKFLERYAVNSRLFIQICAFSRHQRISGKEAQAPSRIPPPSTDLPSENSKGSIGEAPGKHPGSTREAPGIPGREGKGIKTLTRDCAFSRFWEAYPKKRSKGDALKVWDNIKPSEYLQKKIIEAVERFKISETWKEEAGRFIPYPAKWLRNQSWEDEDTTSLIKKETPADIKAREERVKARNEVMRREAEKDREMRQVLPRLQVLGGNS